MKELHFTREQVTKILENIAKEENGMHEIMKMSLEALMRAERNEHNDKQGDMSNGYRPLKGYYQPIYTLMSLKAIEALLPQSDFVRIHRSYIINLSYITFIGRSKVFINEEGIPISGAYRDSFFQIISGNSSANLES